VKKTENEKRASCKNLLPSGAPDRGCQDDLRWLLVMGWPAVLLCFYSQDCGQAEAEVAKRFEKTVKGQEIPSHGWSDQECSAGIGKTCTRNFIWQ
jgi:hypothetical protein